jgi:hypothetical protein
MHKLCSSEYRPPIPDTIDSWVHELIAQWWHQDPDERPPFSDIEKTLSKHDFQVVRDAHPQVLMKHFKDLQYRIENPSSSIRT